MSRLDELKKQYPELNMTFLDILKQLDKSGTYKYMPMFCKIFGKRFNLRKMTTDDNEYYYQLNNMFEYLDAAGIPLENLTQNEKFFIRENLSMFSIDDFKTIKTFIDLIEKNQIKNNDITSYSTIEDIRKSNSLALFNLIEKTLEKEIIKEYEDDDWVIIRPLTFQSSSKYGASTKWCTTYEKEKQYFEKYWRTGVLVYFINKKTGFKFAGFKSLDGSEFTFWSAEDSRVELISLDIDDYLYPIIKKIFKSNDSNKNLCTNEIQELVHNECLSHNERLEPIPMPSMSIHFLEETQEQIQN